MKSSDIPYIAFGQSGPNLHFAHANAYPPGAYRQLLTRLSAEYRVVATEFRPLWPGTDPEAIGSWYDMALDQIRAIDQLGLSPTIGVGHSLGAVTTVMAANERPDLFTSLILIEPVFLDRQLLEHFDQPGINPYKLPLVMIANKRRNKWQSRQEAFEHFRRKKVFSLLSDEALWDYVTAGLHTDQDGHYKLSFPTAWEAWIYAHPPTTVWDYIPRISHPTLCIRGAQSNTLTVTAWKDWQHTQPTATSIEVADASHLLAMEKPAVVADLIIDFLKSNV